MGKKPKPVRLTLLQQYGALHWLIKYLTPIVAFFVLIGSGVATWDKFGWWHPASVQYVDFRVEPGLKTLKDVQIELAEGKRDATQESLYKWTDRFDEEKDPSKKTAYRERVRELEQVLSRQNSQIRTLTRNR